MTAAFLFSPEELAGRSALKCETGLHRLPVPAYDLVLFKYRSTFVLFISDHLRCLLCTW